MPQCKSPAASRADSRHDAKLQAATERRRRKQPRYGRPAVQPVEHDGAPNRAARSAFIKEKIGFPGLYRRSRLIGGRT